MRLHKFSAYSFLFLLSACAVGESRVVEAPRPVIVEVPVMVRVQPPAELLEPIPAPAVDAFVPVGDPRAAVGLTASGAAALHDLVEAMAQRMEALRFWAQATD